MGCLQVVAEGNSQESRGTLGLVWVNFFFSPSNGHKSRPILTLTCACCGEESQDGGVLAERR